MIQATQPTETPLIAVVVPCFNEEEVLHLFYSQVTEILSALQHIRYRIIFVDDGSRDKTPKLLQELAESDPHVRFLSLSRNFGHQTALTAGMDHAGDADAVITMDADTQHPPALLPQLIEAWMQGADIVSAVRDTTADAGPLKRLTSDGFYWLINRLSETEIPRGVADFGLLSSRALAALCRMPERHRFLRGMTSWIGFERAFVTYEAPPRPAGESKYNLLRMLRLAGDAVFSFSSTPLKLATRIGGAVLGLGCLYLLYILGRWIVIGDLIPGWASLLCSVLILGGTQLVCLGLIGEYIARMFDESKGRPLYFLKHDSDAEPRSAAVPHRVHSILESIESSLEEPQHAPNH